MALLACKAIQKVRESQHKQAQGGCGGAGGEPKKTPLHRTAYILRSIKHPDEVKLLRQVYGDSLAIVSASSPRWDRVQSLSENLAKAQQSFDDKSYRKNAEELIKKDKEEEGNKLGQDVSDAFPLGDVFVDTANKDNLRENIGRFLDAYFGHPFVTPTKDEFAMFFAKATALRSADLARQVGAAITDDNGEVVAVGCNEVPRAGGGLYWFEDCDDARDFKVGYDSSALYKNGMLAEILNNLKNQGWLDKKLDDRSVADLVEEATGGDSGFSDTQVMNVIEYGRSVHAEMAAVTDAAKRGVKIVGSNLYCTTYPCHLCAKHIVSSGIKRVVYIEPYPKSQVSKLYPDSIVGEGEADCSGKVRFEPFVGISPGKYMSLFSRGKRKDKDGKAKKWDKRKALPASHSEYGVTYITAESFAELRLIEIFDNNPDLLKEKSWRVGNGTR